MVEQGAEPCCSVAVMGDEPDVELIEAACEKKLNDAITRWELADNDTGCKLVIESPIFYLANGEPYVLVDAPSMFTEESAPAMYCC